jgi:rare lipoprotein A
VRGGLAPTLLSFAAVVLIAGCRHRAATVYVPPAPTLLPAPAPSNIAPPAIASNAPIAPASANPGITSAADLAFVASHAPVWSETGTASWYGPPYNKRRGANGQI